MEAGAQDLIEDHHRVKMEGLTDPQAPRRKLLFIEIMKVYASGNSALDLEATISAVRSLPRSQTPYLSPTESLEAPAWREQDID